MKYAKCLVILALVGASFTVGDPASAAVKKSGPFRYLTERVLVRAGSVSPLIETACPTGTAPVAGAGGFSNPGGRIARFELDLASNWSANQAVNSGASDLTFTSGVVCLDVSVAAPFLGPGSTSGSGPGGVGGTAVCGGSQTLVGGTGGAVGHLGVRLVELGPALTGGWGGFYMTDGSSGSISLKAVCVNGAILESTVVGKTASIRAGRTAAAKVRCPRGSRVSSGGVDSPSSSIVSSLPIDHRSDRDKAPDDGWRGIVHNPTTADSTFTVRALCVRPT